MNSTKHKRVVAIDSMALVWGVKRQSAKGKGKGKDKGASEELVRRTKWLFTSLDEEDATIILPSVVVTEYLTCVEAGNRGNVVAELQQRFFIAPFDTRAAVLAAKLWDQGKSGRAKESANVRKCLRADTLIVATAHVHGAMEFYSYDAKCRRLAAKVMEAKDLPTIPNHLWEYSGK